MSSTNRGSERDPLDPFDTPAWCIEWLLRRWSPAAFPDRDPRFLEPCAGRGAVIETCCRLGYKVVWTAVEIDSGRFDTLCTKLPSDGLVHRAYQDDFLIWATTPEARAGFDAVITNPPFAKAEEFIRTSLQLAPVVCMLLRVNFLGAQKRAKWLSDNVPDVYVLSKRPSFTGHGTDSTEYAWMVWYRQPDDGPRTMGAVYILTPPEADDPSLSQHHTGGGEAR